MGHADYAVLHRYVRLSSERDLGPSKEWSDYLLVAGGAAVANEPAVAWGRN
jgi:hypothetical protein